MAVAEVPSNWQSYILYRRSKLNTPGFSAKVLAHSISQSGVTLMTMEIEYPRFILAELNTHRMLSKNSASSRAIPVTKLRKHISEYPATPVYWGKNKAGMSATEEVDDIEFAKRLWNDAKEWSLLISEAMSDKCDLHKQIANRITEPFVTMKTVISGTEWANFYHLRDDPAAQPEFRVLARLMREAHDKSIPTLLRAGEWHLPYIEYSRDQGGKMRYFNDDKEITLDDAKIISASCCAQVSYRNLNDSLEKCREIYQN